MSPPTIRSNSVLHLQQIINRLYRRVVAASAPPSLVWRPGDTSGSPGVYGSFPALVAAAAAIPGYKVVYLDDSIQDCTVPAGVWDLGGYTVFQGRQRGIDAKICRCIFADLARLVHVFEFHMLDMDSQSSEPVIRTNDLPDNIGAVVVFRASKGTKIYATGAAPFFVENGGPIIAHWWLTEDSELVSAAQPALMSQGRGTSTVVYAADRSVVGKDTLDNLPNTGIGCVYAGVEATINKSQNGSTISTEGVRIIAGSGSPEGVEVGSIGDMYLDRSGSGRALWVKETGNDTNTGWVAK